MHTALTELSTGARVFVAQKGSGGELVIFLHAVGADHTAWYFQMDGLADRYTVVAYDLRGHGRSAFTADDTISVSAFANDAIALIDHCGFRRAHLVGLGLGGVVALEVFRRRSDAVQSLTLAGTFAYHPDADTQVEIVQEQLATASLADNARARVASYFAPSAPREIVDRAFAAEAAKNKGVYLASWTSMFQSDYRRMLELIDVPVLLIGGSLDHVTPVDPHLTAIHANVPTSQLVVIDGAGHFGQLDHPHEFTCALRSHLLRARAPDGQRIATTQARAVRLESGTLGSAIRSLLTRRGVHEATTIAMAQGHWLISGEPQFLLEDHANEKEFLILAGCTPREETKWRHDIAGARDLETAIDRALAIAKSAPAGNVSLTIDCQLLDEPVESFTFANEPRLTAHSSSEASPDAVERAARLIGAAQRPIAIAGSLGRYRGGAEALVQLAQRHAIPVLEPPRRAFFNFPTRHAMHLGFDPAPFIEQADVVLAIESDAPSIPGYANSGYGPTVIQIALDPLQMKRRTSFPADLALAGDPALTLRRLCTTLETLRPDRDKIAGRYSAYASEHRRGLQQAQLRAIGDAGAQGITRAFLSYCIGEAFDDESVLWNGTALDVQLIPRRVADTWFTTASGTSFGAALGGQLANPALTHVVLLDDVSYLANMPATSHQFAVTHNLPLLVIVANAGTSVDHQKIAEACGAMGVRVENPRELAATLRQAMGIVRGEKRHVLVDVVLTQ
ncbi:MAG TPA: alpha/beta fold hydrolase [Thermoanaerobaculia bacterium]|nr:alpha/beta fold hydrolase [Thermoanaerobaculia bacterium]